MKTTNIRELRHDTSTVLGWVALGETVEITRRNQVVAVLTPPKPKKKKKAPRPDFAVRLKEMWGGKQVVPSWTDALNDERGER
jgi:antitoxin (DNA-binding transcriptional repressor) of toxin-antitoxin stability system